MVLRLSKTKTSICNLVKVHGRIVWIFDSRRYSDAGFKKIEFLENCTYFDTTLKYVQFKNKMVAL